MKREGYWFAAILVLVALSLFVVVNPLHYKSLNPKFGLDIKGGVRAILQSHPKPDQKVDQATIVKILDQRLNLSGVGETTVQPKPPDQYIVEIPDTKNKDVVIQRLGTAAQMEFYYFKDVVSNKNPGARYSYNILPVKGEKMYSFHDKITGHDFRDQAQIADDFQALLANSDPHTGATPYTVPAALTALAPSGRVLYFDKSQAAQSDKLSVELDDFNGLIADCGAPIVVGDEINPDAAASLSPQGGAPEPVVTFSLNPAGTTAFGNFTSGHVNELLAMVLDGRVLSAPNVETGITDGKVQISGGFKDLPEAKQLADFLNAGALPVPLTIEQNETVEATLGQNALHKMIIAGIVGMAAVMLFMLLYYWLPGVVACVALIFYTLFTIAVFKGGLSIFIPAVTLSLPGIAGFILSVGMAVDANILIFERLKEELRNGKTLRQAIDAGFRRAFSAIRDSNICTIITCVILYSMGTQTVKGFALTLGLGVGISLFTAITVTRTLLYLLVDAGAGNHPEWFGLKRQWMARHNADGTVQTMTESATSNNIDIIKRRYWFYGLSLLIIVPGAIFYFMGGLKENIEFKGGTQVEVLFSKPVTQDELHAALKKGSTPALSDMHDNLVQLANGGTLAIVSIPDKAATSYQYVAGAQSSVDKTGAVLVTHRGDATDPIPALDNVGVPYTLTSHSLVGGVISKELKQNAFEAVIVASFLIVLYMSFAFSIGGFVAGLRFGTSAIVALLHDVLVLIGAFSIFGYLLNWQIDSLFITATLTVVGFSVHDTIVIFDRLRENLRHRLKGESFEALANRSILQSFARSVNTSLTVIMTLVAMLIFGEPSTRLLVVALIVGIISGTYSSIFNATSILVDWEMWLAGARSGSGSPSAPSSPDAWRPSQAPAPTPTPIVPTGPSAGAANGTGEAKPGGRSSRPPRGGATRRF